MSVTMVPIVESSPRKCRHAFIERARHRMLLRMKSKLREAGLLHALAIRMMIKRRARRYALRHIPRESV